MEKKIFFATLVHETSTFSPIPTTMLNFQESGLVRPSDDSDDTVPTVGIMKTCLENAAQRHEGWGVMHGTMAFAQPSAPLVTGDFESLRNEILKQLQEAGSLGAVVLYLHGSMMADGYDDCEGDILKRARTICGDDIPIGVVLDPHCHLTRAMVEHADMIILMKEYPHTDILECLDKLLDVVIAKAEKRVQLCCSIFDCHQITLYRTGLEPMRSFVDRMRAEEEDPDVVSISVVHGFPWSDHPDLGTKVLVTTDGNQKKADALAQQLGSFLIENRTRFTDDFMPLKQGLDHALQIKEGPIVLADIADNPGGGAAGDATYVLRAMMERGMFDTCIGNFWDPQAVKFCQQVGEGATINIRIGGKVGPYSGTPVDLKAFVIKIKENVFDYAASIKAPLGTLVGLRLENGLELSINDIRTQNRSPIVFTDVGIDPLKKRYVVVKSSNLFHEKYAPIAKEIIYLDAPGSLVSDLSLLDYQKRPSPLWPFEKGI